MRGLIVSLIFVVCISVSAEVQEKQTDNFCRTVNKDSETIKQAKYAKYTVEKGC